MPASCATAFLLLFDSGHFLMATYYTYVSKEYAGCGRIPCVGDGWHGKATAAAIAQLWLTD